MKVVMLNDFILVRLLLDDEKTESGVILPTAKGERTEAKAIKAEVIEPNKNAPEIKKGMIVYVGNWELNHAVIHGTKYAMIKKDWVFMEVR